MRDETRERRERRRRPLGGARRRLGHGVGSARHLACTLHTRLVDAGELQHAHDARGGNGVGERLVGVRRIVALHVGAHLVQVDLGVRRNALAHVLRDARRALGATHILGHALRAHALVVLNEAALRERRRESAARDVNALALAKVAQRVRP